MERLESAATMDGQYHAAKLTAAAFADPARIWTEHEEFRSLVLTDRAAPPREALEASALALLARVNRAKAGVH